MAYSLVTLASVAIAQKDNETAVKLSSEAIDIMHRAGRDATAEAVFIRNSYAQALWMVGRDDEALVEIDRALDDWQRVAPTAKGAPHSHAGAEGADPRRNEAQATRRNASPTRRSRST